MNCPRDHSLLSSSFKGELEVNVCCECNGFSIVLHQEAASNLERQLNRSLAAAGGRNTVELLASPYTGKEMRRFVYRDVQLDYCPHTHSIWFDRGEYSKMFRAPEKEPKPKRAAASDASPWDGSLIETVADSTLLLDFAGEVLVALASGGDLF